MNNRYITNVPSRLDLFYDIWVSCLFVPIVIGFAHLLLSIKNLISIAELDPVLEFILEFLGFSFVIILAHSVRTASKHSRNDFVAGPIEMFNLYTFFLLGILIGGFRGALILTALYELLETFGWRWPEEFKSISGTEWVKAQRLGITRGKFILYQFIFAPLTTILTLWLSLKFSSAFISIDGIANMDFANQIKSLSLCIALWKAGDTIFNSIYNLSLPRLGGVGFTLSICLFFVTYTLASNNWLGWLFYTLLIIFGWASVITNIASIIQARVEDEDARELIKKMQAKNSNK